MNVALIPTVTQTIQPRSLNNYPQPRAPLTNLIHNTKLDGEPIEPGLLLNRQARNIRRALLEGHTKLRRRRGGRYRRGRELHVVVRRECSPERAFCRRRARLAGRECLLHGALEAVHRHLRMCGAEQAEQAQYGGQETKGRRRGRAAGH